LVSGPLMMVKGIPALVKVGFAFLLSVVVFPTLNTEVLSIPDSIWGYVLQAIGEVMIGLELGLISSLIIYLFQMSGHLLDIQIGFSISALFDPLTGAQNTIIAHLMYMFALVVFLSLNGHHSLILALVKSYELQPLNAVNLGAGAQEVVLRTYTGIFSLSLRVAAPVVLVLVITDMALGLIARTASQMNIFMLTFPLKVFIGLVFLCILLPFTAVTLGGVIRSTVNNLLLLMKGLS